MVSKKRKPPTSRRTTGRHLWLAGLGLARVTAREAVGLPGRLFASASQMPQDAATGLAEVVGGVRKRIAAACTPADPAATQFSDAVERRLATVLVKFGLRPAKTPARPRRRQHTT